MQNAQTKDNQKNPEYHVVTTIRKLRADKNCFAEKSCPNHVKTEQHIGSEKTHGLIQKLSITYELPAQQFICVQIFVRVMSLSPDLGKRRMSKPRLIQVFLKLYFIWVSQTSPPAWYRKYVKPNLTVEINPLTLGAFCEKRVSWTFWWFLGWI